MDSDKLQKLANLAVVRQHAAAVSAVGSFPRKLCNKVNATLNALDNEFVNLLIDTVGDAALEDTVTLSKRIAEEKAKLAEQKLVNTNTVVTMPEPMRPKIKGSKSNKE